MKKLSTFIAAAAMLLTAGSAFAQLGIGASNDGLVVRYAINDDMQAGINLGLDQFGPKDGDSSMTIDADVVFNYFFKHLDNVKLGAGLKVDIKHQNDAAAGGEALMSMQFAIPLTAQLSLGKNMTVEGWAGLSITMIGDKGNAFAPGVGEGMHIGLGGANFAGGGVWTVWF